MSAGQRFLHPEAVDNTGVTVRVGSLTGPTSMGLVSLMNKTENSETANLYEFTMASAADEINTRLIKGDLDIVLIPADVASVLYNRTEGQVTVIDINTLGVLYVLETGTQISQVSDLKGKTIYLTGKGATPDYALQYILAQNDLAVEDVDLQYKSEAAEVISAIAQQAIPFCNITCITGADMKTALAGYLEVLGGQNAESIGGTLPGDDFYYSAE